VLLGIAVVTVALWWRTLARHWRLAGGVAVLGALLLVPHVVEAMTASGVPWGTLVDARTATRDAPLRTTVATYLGWLLDGTLAGPLGLALIVVGATVGPVLVVTRWRDASGGWEARGLLWIGLSALLVSVPIATSAAPEARYAFPPLFLGLIVGAKGALEAIAWLAARLQWPRMAPTARVALAVALLASFVASSAAAALDARRAATADGWRAEAARAITADSGGRCSLVVPWPLRPTFFWYTACPTIAGGGGEPPPTPWVEDGGTGYVVDHVAASEGRRIPDDVVAAYREVAASEPLVTYRASDGSEIAEVLRIER
jgi:hypothetical protein